MTTRFQTAHAIWHGGASNPRAVARELVKAIDEACEEGDSSAAANDPAVHMIMDQLCWLVGLPMISSSVSDWGLTMKAVEEKCDETQAN